MQGGDINGIGPLTLRYALAFQKADFHVDIVSAPSLSAMSYLNYSLGYIIWFSLREKVAMPRSVFYPTMAITELLSTFVERSRVREKD